jgi:heterodisulfide reductase subunit C
MLRKGWLRTLIERMNKLALLRDGKLGAFIARFPLKHGMKMGLAMVFKPRTKSWGRTGEVLSAYVEEQQKLAHARLATKAH